MLSLPLLLLRATATCVAYLATGTLLPTLPQPAPTPPKPAAPFLAHGVKDTGVFSAFDAKINYSLPALPQGETRIHVNKKARVLVLYDRTIPRKAYPIALGFAPVGHKVRQGDGKTPEGSYTLCDKLEKNLDAKYGARSLRLSYPGLADAKAGLASKLLDQATFERIRDAHARGIMPPQTTALGGSIRIHGGGATPDWTLGCIALQIGRAHV